MTRRILIIEDEPGLQMTLEDRLVTEGYEVSLRGDGLSGEEEARRGGWALILLDVMLPGRDGFGVCRNLRKSGITTPILMLTARNTPLDTVTGLREGADDYLAKPFDMGVLLARIEALLRRSSPPEPGERGPAPSRETVIRFGPFTLDRERGLLLEADREVTLNAREYQLLEYLCLRPGRVIPRDNLLDDVWGYDTETTSRTVDVHIAKVRQKLGETQIPRYIHTVRGRGYRFSREG